MVNLVDSALDFWLTSGRYTEEFEKDLGEYLGVPLCLPGELGLQRESLRLHGADLPAPRERQIRPGDEVITVAAGFPTTVTPMIQYGAVPVFVDVTIPQYNIDVNCLEKALSEKTKAVMLAHTLGNPFDLAAVRDFCSRHSLWLIEDNCDALGSRYELDNTMHFTGTVGDIGTSSFYPPHHMTMGEGGAVYTRTRCCTASSAPCGTGGATACAPPAWTISAATALTDSTGSCRRATTTNMSTPTSATT